MFYLECEINWKELHIDYPMEQSNICTGSTPDGRSACSADSGGPLINETTIIGIVSWGYFLCGSPGAPTTFTQVSHFIDFIKEYVKDF